MRAGFHSRSWKRSFVVVFTPEPVIGSITCLHRSSDLIATCACSIPAALREDLDDLNIFFIINRRASFWMIEEYTESNQKKKHNRLDCQKKPLLYFRVINP